VEATIALARLIRSKQPRLFDYALSMRRKQTVLEQLDLAAMKPVLHVSGMFGAARNNVGLVVPLTLHPRNKNEIICYDLAVDPTPLAELDADALRERLFTPTAELPAGVERLGIKSIHINKSPIVATPKLLDPAAAERLGIDGALCRSHRQQLTAIPQLVEKLRQVYQGREFKALTDPDRMLYSGGFFADSDKRSMERIRAATPQQLGEQSMVFEDPRLAEMLFRYRARNYPHSLSDEEMAQWEEFRFQYLTDPEAGASITMDDYHATIESMLADTGLTAEKQQLLQQLLEYGDELLS
jgi:exodeoxyribonuclease-1